MIAKKKTYNSIARSFRSKPSLLINFFLTIGDKSKTETRRETFQQNIFTIAS